MTKQDRLRLITYCGLYCGLCAQHSRIPQQARQLQRSLSEEGFDDFYQYEPAMKDTFPIFWRFLGKLAKFDCNCRTGQGGPPDCRIRECAKQRNITVCPKCSEYPCNRIQLLAGRYPTLIQDGKRMCEVGVEKWAAEQEERARRGFVYSDIRHPRKP